jgi:uncharacterized membrane protein YqjE
MSDERKPRLADSLRGFLDSGLETAQTRLELLALEAQEEKLRVTSLLFNTVLSALMLSFGVAFLGIFLTVLMWDSHRLLALGLASAAFLGTALFAARNAARDIRQGSRLFAASLAELANDREALRRKE